ncbi:MAG TPA: Rrf2 family transcriptional regulator [Gammaproteobacteria bacterium]|nr:Rrf2 family transcriptional regulator [Gammaproteobacteria bacterium]
MKLSSRSDYATKAMLELSTTPDKPVNLAYLAQVEDISISYLEQIFSLLRKHELVKSVRGPGGGYILSKPMSDITIGDIVKAIDMNRKSKKIERTENINDPIHQPASQQMWEQLSIMLYDYLNKISLEDVHNANARQLQFENEQNASGIQAA